MLIKVDFCCSGTTHIPSLQTLLLLLLLPAQ
jgi:hypothetical protein